MVRIAVSKHQTNFLICITLYTTFILNPRSFLTYLQKWCKNKLQNSDWWDKKIILRSLQPENQYHPLLIIRRAQDEPSNPSVFGQMLSFEIFTQSESIGSTQYVVKFSYSNSI